MNGVKHRSFQQTVLALHGDTGRRWLDALPEILVHYAENWGLTLEAPFENLSYNYVAPVRRTDGMPAVLKVGIPHDELRAEIAALCHLDGRGSVRLYEADEENCAMLLERIFPGETLWDVDDEIATTHLLEVMPKLWQSYRGDYPFKTVADWGQGFARLRQRHNGTTGKLDTALVEKAEKIFFELVFSSVKPVLLHGDLHHDNVLSAQREPYLAIDPKGVLGEPCYEVGAFLRNPLPGLLKGGNPRKLMQRRVDMIVERLGFDRQRVIGWGMSQAVLSAIWCDEDGIDCTRGVMHVATILEEILQERKPRL